MPVKDAVATVLNRNAFYRDGYRLLLRLSVIQMAVIVLLIVGIVSMVLTTQTRQIFFATTTDGRIIPIVPLSEPFRDQGEVAAWAQKTAQNVMRFDYIDYLARLQQVSDKFTPAGWDNFNKALKDSNILEAVKARKLVVSLLVNAAPDFHSVGVRNGVYTWEVYMPVTVKFDGQESVEPIIGTLKLTIERVSTLQSADGISIAQWALSSGK